MKEHAIIWRLGIHISKVLKSSKKRHLACKDFEEWNWQEDRGGRREQGERRQGEWEQREREPEQGRERKVIAKNNGAPGL